MRKRAIKTLGVSLACLAVLGSTPVQAFGPSPAFEKTKNISAEKQRELVLYDVKEKIQNIAPAMTKTFEETALNKTLVTDYKEIDYPSQVEGTAEGVDKDGNTVLDALKKPITETSKIELAEMVRYYQFNMTDQMSFTPLDPESRVARAQALSAGDKLNYFDYIKLIDTIADNSQYDNKEKVARLNQVEKDLEQSISLLYGDTRNNVHMQAWGETKRVSAPFKRDKYSYKQLLAAYEKNEVIIETLSYYSAVLDTLEDIKTYSINRRMHRPASIDAGALAAKVNERYARVSEVLVAPVSDILAAQQDDKARYESARREEEEALKQAGLGGDQ